MRHKTVAAICLTLAACNQPKPESPPKSQAKKVEDYASRIGIALQSPAGICLSIGNATLSANAPVSLITPSQPQSVADGVVTGPGPGCPGADPDQPGYALHIQRGKVEDNLELIAVIGGPKLSVTDHGEVIGDLDNDAQKETFRSCTSAEGVHLTVWKGQPLQGVRIWHGYYHLDYDVESKCTEAETAQ
jgi:hypothetical protein